MAIATEEKTEGKLTLGVRVELKVSRVLDANKVFVIFFDGDDKPVLMAKSIAAKDGYGHRSQFMDKTLFVTPTQPSNGERPGWLADVELPFDYVNEVGLKMMNFATASRTYIKSLADQAAEEN